MDMRLSILHINDNNTVKFLFSGKLQHHNNWNPLGCVKWINIPRNKMTLQNTESNFDIMC